MTNAAYVEKEKKSPRFELSISSILFFKSLYLYFVKSPKMIKEEVDRGQNGIPVTSQESELGWDAQVSAEETLDWLSQLESGQPKRKKHRR